jgi:hypothetical protein
VYIEQPDGFVIHAKESHVCRLKKTLYGLKQAPCAWYARIDGYLMSLGSSKSVADANMYYKIVDGKSLILICTLMIYFSPEQSISLLGASMSWPLNFHIPTTDWIIDVSG